MQDLDKSAMGRRIRQIRSRAGLRQWELAEILGTTQSAVHKYEHGVVPEPRRLIELARVGETTVEWILTGSHWENGSAEQARLSPELLRTATLIREILDDDRGRIDEALRIVREAANALDRDGRADSRADASVVASALSDHAPATLRLLEDAWRIQRAVMKRVLADAHRRLDASPVGRSGPARDDSPDSGPRRAR